MPRWHYTGILPLSPPRRLGWQLLFLAAVALLVYAPSLTIPLIADDYPNLSQALTYGAPTGLGTLLHDAQFRLRATSYWAMYGLWHIAGLAPVVYHAASLALHIANTWLVFFVAAAWPRMRPAAFWAAAFFAVHEGHQEAVMWFSAVNELLMFLFGMASLWCWRSASASAQAAWLKELAGVVLFALALVSKESAVILLPLFVVAVEPAEWRRRLPRLAPHLALALLAVASVAESRSNSFRFSDGSFSLHAPFWLAWPHSFARLLWIWGWPAVVVLFVFGDARLRRAAWSALAWVGIALVPYSFLTYSTEIPSRQVYLASAGLALVVGLAMTMCQRRRFATALFALILLHNTVYLWTKKRAQFVLRAAPTSELIGFARQTPGPIWVQCFPLPPMVAEEAVRLATGRPPADLVWSAGAARERAAARFCYGDKGRGHLIRYSVEVLKRFRSSALRISGSRGFARAITIREKEAKILHPTKVREAIRFESAKSVDRIWQRPSKLMALQIKSELSEGSTGKYIESVFLNLKSTFIFADTSGSPSRISFMRSNAAYCRLPGMRSQDELRTTYFGAPVTRSPRKYADSVEITSPCKNVKSSSGWLNPRAFVFSDKIGERTIAPEALRTAIRSRESFMPAANCLIAVSATSL
jgi:hypothetical protein